MKPYTSSDVMEAIKNIFPKHIKDVEEIIFEYGKENHEKEENRVRLAVLKLSNGDLDGLIQFIDLAKQDYRDVLLRAEYDTNGNEVDNPYNKILGNFKKKSKI